MFVSSSSSFSIFVFLPTKHKQASASTCTLESISPPTEEQPTKYKQASTSHSCTLESISPPTKEQLTKHTRGARVILYFKSANNLTEEPPTKHNQTCPSHPCTLRPITPPDKKQPLLVYPLERCAFMVCFRIYYAALFSMMIITAKQGHFLNIDFMALVSYARSGVLSFNLLGLCPFAVCFRICYATLFSMKIIKTKQEEFCAQILRHFLVLPSRAWFLSVCSLFVFSFV